MMEHQLIVYHNYGLKAGTRVLTGPKCGRFLAALTPPIGDH